MDLGNACSGFDEDILAELRSIVAQHEGASGFLTQLMGYVGEKIESLTSKMPDNWQAHV